jgi:hypothetical protein
VLFCDRGGPRHVSVVMCSLVASAVARDMYSFLCLGLLCQRWPASLCMVGVIQRWPASICISGVVNVVFRSRNKGSRACRRRQGLVNNRGMISCDVRISKAYLAVPSADLLRLARDHAAEGAS